MSDQIPVTVIFFPNEMTAVCDSDGEQIGKYQGRHKFSVGALKTDGYEWSELPEVLGVPAI